MSAVLLVASSFAPEAPDRTTQLIGEIETIAAGEPPVLGIDTEIRAAQILLKERPVSAARLLRDAASRTMALTDLHTRGMFLAEIAASLAQVDPGEAESLCATLPRRAPDAREDPLATCFNGLLNRTNEWSESRELFRRALASGAFDASALVEHVQQACKKHPEDAAAEYAAMVDAFPESDTTPGEVRRLLELVRAMGLRAPELTRVALERAQRSLSRPRFRVKASDGDELRDSLSSLQTGRKREDKRDREPRKTGADEGPSIEGMSTFEVVSLARKLKPAMAVEMLLHVVDEDKELPLPRRLAIAYEALEYTAKMPMEDDRLVAQSMLTRRIYEYGDRPKAAVAAQMLAETYEKMYDCDSEGCVAIQGADGPGEIIFSFAEYLCENGIRPEDLGLSNRSLRVRMLLFDLKEAVEGKRPRFAIF